MIVNGYELIKDWKVSNIGMTAVGRKNAKKWFMKRYGEYKMPRRDASVTDALYARLKKEFDDFKDYRIRINMALSGMAGTGGNIIAPSDWFVDDIYYIEATEFVDGLIEDEAIYDFSSEDIQWTMLTATAALYNIHRKKIVHGDLKRTNIVVARNASGKTVGKLIDFDRSYFEDDIRADYIGGDQSFMAPELAQCFIYDMADEALSYLSTKADIFSLGLVFHNYLTGGDFPKMENLPKPLKEREKTGNPVYIGEAALGGATLLVSKKIKEKYLQHLIVAMLQTEPDARPTAQEVLDVLKAKRIMEISSDSGVRIEGEPVVKARIKGAEEDSTVTKEEAPSIPTGYCAPWKEHNIRFIESKLTVNGYIASEQCEKKGIKCYQFYKKAGVKRVLTLENVLILGLAEKCDSERKDSSLDVSTSEAEKAETLWPEDSAYAFDMGAITGDGYKSIIRKEKNGLKGYAVVKKNDDQRFMTIDKLVLLRYVKKK